MISLDTILHGKVAVRHRFYSNLCEVRSGRHGTFMNNSSKFKLSQFNVVTDLDDGGMIVRNLFQNNYLYISPDNKRFFSYLLEDKDFLDAQDDCEILEGLINKMKDMKMIIDSNITEYQQVDAWRHSISYSSNNLDLTILPTNACNFRCAYCFESEGHQYMSTDTEDRLCKFMDRDFKKYKTVYIQWFGGEPLLCKDNIKRIMTRAQQIARRDKVSVVAGITTNGYELDVDTYKDLCKLGIIWIQLSVDGTQRIHNAQRPHKINNDSYTKIIQNLRDIRDNTTAGVCKIYYRVTVSKQTLPYIDEILSFYKDEFSRDKRFCLSLQPVMDWGGERVENMRDDLPIVEDTVGCLMTAAKLGLLPIGHHTQPNSALVCESIRNNSFVVGPGNMLQICPMAIYNNNTSNLNRGIIGTLEENGELKIDPTIKAEWMEVEPVMGDQCKKCMYYAICHGNVTCPYSCKFSDKKQFLCKKHIYDKYIPAETQMMYMLGKVKEFI